MVMIMNGKEEQISPNVYGALQDLQLSLYEETIDYSHKPSKKGNF
jgi:hypothetical protein